MLKRLLMLLVVILTLVSLISACSNGKTSTTPSVTAPPSTTPVSTTATPTSTATVTPTTTVSPSTTPVNSMDNDVNVAEKMVLFFNNIQSVQNYYADGLTAMANFEVKKTSSTVASLSEPYFILTTLSYTDKTTGAVMQTDFSRRNVVVSSSGSQIPPEFLTPLPPSGTMPAPAGACPAAANPDVNFKTKSGETVTPDMFVNKDVETIPSELVMMAQDDPDSLVSLITNMVPLGDQSLATAAGWDNLLWSKLRAMQEPAASLMDYQLWNASDDIMEQISAQYREKLVSYGVPQIVLDAYDASAATNWYSAATPSESDALAQMDIQAELTGTVTGTVHEQRDFEIPGLAQTPIYGVQTGDGIVSWDDPRVGEKIDFSVDINLDQYDAGGRAIGGKVIADAIGYEGYQVEFTFTPPDGKDGVVLKNGEPVGYLTMTVDHDKFENYIDIKSGTSVIMPDGMKLPEDVTGAVS